MSIVPNKKKVFVAIFCFCCVIVWTAAISVAGENMIFKKIEESSSRSSAVDPFYSISQIKRGMIPDKIFYTEGFVAKIYSCPPCPEGALCKPCMRDNIIISENNQPLSEYHLTEKELIIFVSNPNQFQLGKKIKLLVMMSDRKSTSDLINDLELVAVPGEPGDHPALLEYFNLSDKFTI